MNRYKKLSKKAKGALIVGSCLAAGAAFAWSTGGDGVFGGSFQSAPQPLHAVASYPSSQLAPSGTADVEAVISNPNSGPITLHTVTLTSPFTGSALFLSDCKGHVGFNKDTFTGLNVTIPGNGQATVTLPNAMAADADTPETCEGVQFQVPVGAMTAG